MIDQFIIIVTVVIVLICFYIHYTSQFEEVTFIKSKVNNKKYLVLKHKNNLNKNLILKMENF